MKGKRLSRAETAALIITLLLAALVIGYHLGRGDERAEAHMTVMPLETEAASVTQSGQISAENGLININTASEAELQLLPGIGEVRARNIVEYREANGPFEKIEDITLVSGIGSGIFEDIIDLITIGGN